MVLVSVLLSIASAEPTPAYVSAGWQLPQADGLYERWDPARSWATSFVVGTLQSVAARVALELPLADPILIGDISRRGGGAMPGHKNHNLGIDVDIGLFMDDGRQPLGGFVDLRPSQLDAQSTWVLVRTLMETGQVQYILLDQGHIDRLRGYLLHEEGFDTETVDAVFPPPSEIPKWSEGSGYVRHAPNHRNHLHVRLKPPPPEPAPPAPPEPPDRLAPSPLL